MENQSIQQDKNLINKIRQNSNKKKKNFKWVSILWLIGIIAVAIIILFIIYAALKPIQQDKYSQTVNVTLTSDDTFKNTEEIKKIKLPSDFVDYNLIVKNNLQNNYEVYLRFRALTYIDDAEYTVNLMEFDFNNQDRKDDFYYDEANDTWYYNRILGVGESVRICDKIGVSAYKTTNEYAGKEIKFFVLIEAVKTDIESVWNDAPIEWTKRMEIE